MTDPNPSYRRVLLKLSGEALENKETGLHLDPSIISGCASAIREVHDLGVQVALVVGGGNIFRGMSGELRGISRSQGDYMGMLATVINALALQAGLEKHGVDTRVMTSISMPAVAEPFIRL